MWFFLFSLEEWVVPKTPNVHTILSQTALFLPSQIPATSFSVLFQTLNMPSVILTNPFSQECRTELPNPVLQFEALQSVRLLVIFSHSDDFKFPLLFHLCDYWGLFFLGTFQPCHSSLINMNFHKSRVRPLATMSFFTHSL